MQALEAILAAAGPGPLEAAVFGTTDPSEIAARLSAIVAAADGAAVHGCRWYSASVAAVAGITLDDGREIVVRAYGPEVSTAFLTGVVRVQRHLAASGFPCAEPLSGAVSVARSVGRIESVLDDPGARRPARREMAASARGLGRLVRLTSGIDPAGLEEHPMKLSARHLYPRPHSPLFDFEATAAGAAWIDEIAAAARAAMSDDPPVIAHGDWSARNVRLRGEAVVGVYDWESLQHAPESLAVGVAAATWSALGQPGEPLAPPAADLRQYVDLYQEQRERPFSAAQDRGAVAAALFALAYTARCEHALSPGITSGRASGRLSSDRAELLALLA